MFDVSAICLRVEITGCNGNSDVRIYADAVPGALHPERAGRYSTEGTSIPEKMYAQLFLKSLESFKAEDVFQYLVRTAGKELTEAMRAELANKGLQ